MRRQADTLRFLSGLLAPGGVLVLAAWALQNEAVVRNVAEPYAAFFSFGALVAAVLLSWYYDQSRLLCSALVVGLAVLAQESSASFSLPRQAVLVLLPLNFSLFAVLRERGVITLDGMLKVGFVAAQAASVQWLAPRIDTSAWPSWAPQLSFAVAALTLLTLVFHRRTKVEQGLAWAIVAMWLGLGQTADPAALFFYSGTAGLILVFAVLEHGYDIAYRDELTGLPSRRAFNHAMEQLSGAYVIAMCDVDHFKRFNDTHGHDAGDHALRMVAEKLSHVKGGGRAFRYGGEEFLVVFRGCSAREAEPFAQAVRAAIADASLVPRSPEQLGRPAGPLKITISIGIAEKSKRHSTPELVLDAADAAMYRAKEAGRNCVKVAEGTPELEVSRLHLEHVRTRRES